MSDLFVREKKSSLKWLCIALFLCLVSMIGASLVQTSNGSVTIKDIRWETPSGLQMSGLLLIPHTASKVNPAPAIVTSHGWYNNREMQDLNYVEYARRGYVVLSIDMYGHGHSDLYEGVNGWQQRGTGMYDAVELLATLPYVDLHRIGVTGHSNGARAANLSVLEDNKKAEPLISAVLLVGSDALYKNPDTGDYWNIYGKRDVGIIAGQYDEFFFRSDLGNGQRSKPRDFINTDNAQSFLSFGAAPNGDKAAQRQSYTEYTQTIDGKIAHRIIYNPVQTHPWNHFSAKSVSYGIEFFQQALGAPHPLDSHSQIWQWKTAFNALGLIGIFIFMTCFARLLILSPIFSSLRSNTIVEPLEKPHGAGLVWFWGGLLFCTFISAISYLPSLEWALKSRPNFMMQVAASGISVWAAICGVATIFIMIISYIFYGKKHGMNLNKLGVFLNIGQLIKSVLLALIVVSATFSIVFIVDFFAKVDFRIWVLTMRTFTLDHVLYAWPYLPLFLIYFIANSVAINCFNYNKIGGSKEWINLSILAFFNICGPLILILIQYSVFFSTGEVAWGRPNWGMGPLSGIWLFPMLVLLPLAAIISRKIYKVSNNPYIAPLIFGLFITIVVSTNTLTAAVN